MTKHHPFIKSIFYAGYVFLYLPLVLIVVASFNASPLIKWHGFSLKWYRDLCQNTHLIQATWTSLKIAFLSATLSVIIATICSTVTNHSTRIKINIVATFPLLVPEVVMGLSSLFLFVELKKWGWMDSHFFMVVAAHTTLGAAYATEIIQTSLHNIDPSIKEASLNLGASRTKTLFLITLPLIFPSIMSSWMIAFLLSFDDVILSTFTSGPGITTLPMLIFSNIKLGQTPQINALATCIIFLTAPIILVMSYLYKKSNKKLYT